MEPTLIFGAIGAIATVGGVGAWAVRVEGKVQTLKAVVDEREKREESRDLRLERIENKLDAYFNAHNGNGKG